MGEKPVPTKPRKPTTEKEIETGITGDEIFGIVKGDLRVPEHLEKHFPEFPPLFKNTEIKLEKDIVGQQMYEYKRCSEITYFK